MRPTERRSLGSTGLQVTQMGLGTAPLGSMQQVVSDEAAAATLHAAWDAGIRYYDTAPWYGRGLSERRVGTFLSEESRDQFVLSTKVGRLLLPAADPTRFDPTPWVGGLPYEAVFDYTYDGIMRSYGDSLERLGLSSIDLLLIHDLDGHQGPDLERYWAQLTTSGWRALQQLRDSGAVRGIGAGINTAGLVHRLLTDFDMDVILMALPYTLLEQGALDYDLPLCVERNVGVIIGAVFGSGILATGGVDRAQYRYADAAAPIVDKVRRLNLVCERHGVSLPAAALQFPLGHPAVSSVIPGAFQAEQVRQNVEQFQRDVPDSFWCDLKAESLLAEHAPVPPLSIT